MYFVRHQIGLKIYRFFFSPSANRNQQHNTKHKKKSALLWLLGSVCGVHRQEGQGQLIWSGYVIKPSDFGGGGNQAYCSDERKRYLPANGYHI